MLQGIEHMNRQYILVLMILAILPGCIRRDPKVPQKNIKHMDIEEACNARDYYRSIQDKELLMKSLERIVALSTDYELTDKALLELADLKLQEGNLEVAQKLYGEYNALYPGSAERERAWYNEILAHYRHRTTPDRDQSRTRTTVNLTKRFLEEFSQNSYTENVRDIRRSCYKLLLKHELLNIQFYMHNYLYQENLKMLDAARRRLVYIAQEILSSLASEYASLPLIQDQIIKLYKEYELTTQKEKDLYANIIFYLNELEAFTQENAERSWQDVFRNPRDRF